MQISTFCDKLNNGDIMFGYSDDKILFHHSIDTHPVEIEANLASPKTHNRNEIFYFISGRASYSVEGSIYKLAPGTVMIMRSGEMHKIIIEADVPYERMALHFDADIINAVDKSGMLLEPFYNRPLGIGNLYYSSAYKCQAYSIYDVVNRTHRLVNGCEKDNDYIYIPFVDKKGVYLKVYFEDVEMEITKDIRYLATINNLAEPVVKTSSKTMKVTYTITEE